MWKRLKLLLESKVSKSQYLELQHQLGKEPNPEKCPPDFNDLPSSVQSAIQIYNKLGDRVGETFLGKDYTLLATYKSLDMLPKYDLDLFMEALLILDEYYIDKSRTTLQNELKKSSKKKK